MDGLSLNTIGKQYMAVNDCSRPKMKSGLKKKVNEKVTTKIYQAARKVRCTNQLVTARKVKNELTYDISIRSIQRTLRVNNFKYQSVERYMPLTKKYMEDRVNKATYWLPNCHL